MAFDHTQFNCPNCGAPLGTRLRSTKMVDCDHCNTTVWLHDDGFESLGTRGVMAERPSLLELGKPFRHQRTTYEPIGQARFSYGHGWWDEFWTTTPEDGVWISVDEGDIAIERPTDIATAVDLERLQPGAVLWLDEARWVVSEQGRATCEAVRGEFPEVLRPGDQFRYWHLSGPGCRLITVEASDGAANAHEGFWVDPFAITTS